MPTTKYIQTNFTSGEISKKMEGRIDFDRYYNAVSVLRNWLPMVQGGVTRRPGLRFVDYPKYSNKLCRLIPFEYGVTQAYVIEVGDLYMRFYRNGYLVRIVSGGNLVTNGDFPTDITTGWTNYSVSPGSAVWDSGTAKLTAVEAADSGHIQVNVESVGGTFTRLTGSFVTDGFVSGQTIITSGFTNAGNNATKIIDTVTALVIKVTDATGLVTETGDGNEEITAALSIGSIGQSIVTTSGKTYLLTFDVITAGLHLRIGTTAQGTEILNDVAVPVGTTIALTFIARGTPTYIQFLKQTNGASKIDNVVCKLYDPVEVTTSPYYEADLPNLKWAQDSDNLYIVHPNYAPRRLTRSSDTVWTLTTLDNNVWEDGPYFAIESAPTITPTGTLTPGSSVTLLASAPLWDTSTPSKHIGALWRICHTSTWGCVIITAVTDSTHATATVLKTLGGNTASTYQREGRWSDLRGWPRSITFHQNRLILGGASASPQTIWGSATEDPYNMTPGANDADAFSFTIGSTKVNLIRWIVSAKGLIIGTNGGIFRGTGQPITPSNIQMDSEASDGAANMMALSINPAIIFVQRAGKQVMEVTYHYDSDSYETQDLSILADNLTDDGLEDMVFQGGYNPIIWNKTTVGDLVALTYNRNQKVIAWSHHITSGTIESLAVIPNSIEAWDDVYVVTKRTINSVEMRFIELLDPYLNTDCGIGSSFSSPVSKISGLEHLSGELVDLVGDDAVYPQVLVDANGQITVDPPASNIEVGFHYASYLETLKPEIKQDQKTIQPNQKRWTRLFARLYNTVGLKINGEIVPFRSSLDSMDSGITPFTGDKRILNLGWNENGVVTIEQDLPLFATVLCIFGTLEVNET